MKTKRLLLLILLSLQACTNISAPIITGEKNTALSQSQNRLADFYPVNNGNQWIYQLEQFQDEKPVERFKEMIITVTEQKDKTAVFKRNYPQSPIQPPATLVEIFPDRIDLSRYNPTLSETLVANKKENSKSITILQTPLSKGTKWEGRLFQGGREIITITGLEKVTVPAGTFSALKINHQIKYDNGREDNLYYWYAEKTGTVKMYEEISLQMGEKWLKMKSIASLKSFNQNKK